MDLTDIALSSFKAFNILFDNEQAVFAPGEELAGKIFIHPINDIQISPITLNFKGYGTLCDQNDESLLEAVKYWDESVDLGTDVETLAGGKDHSVPFKKLLPMNLETSIESKSLTVTYSVKARFTYRYSDNNVFPLACIRGFSIVVPTQLDSLDVQHFKPNNYFATKKHGGFLCTAGHVNLKIDVERTAYVGAENLCLEGQLENNSGRRVDSVIAILQKVIEVMGYTAPNSKAESSCEKPTLTTVSTEVVTVKKENLAMYIDPRATTRISRNFAVPACRPSSLEMIHVGQHSISVSYRLLVKVKQVNEICGICIPIFIGSVPHSTAHTRKNRWMNPDLKQAESERRAHYQRDLSERPCSLYENNESYLSKLNRMLHINHYPYFPYLPSSAKQSRQFRMLASAVRAENMFMAKLKANEKKTADQQRSPKENSFDSIQQLKPEKLLLVSSSNESSFADLLSKTSSKVSWPSNMLRSSPSRSPLPPVEISLPQKI